ncbi:MAG: hypothetical protein BGN96_04270 [Bacteroidales bacterium 45-6]|nr:MAG: hypothetical protein BGN96_04270 [Bacteroidales bacterium 45-6]
MERKIEASLKPIGQSVGMMADAPKEENKFVPMPDNLKNINALMGERVAIVRPPHGVPEKKGFKI